MRKLIAGMKISVDGKMEGPAGTADWVAAWSDDYGIMPQVDACLLGGGMYPGYEKYWTSLQKEPDKPAWITGTAPTPAEIEWARFAARTPHYVLSKTLTSALWPQTSFVRGLEDVAALKKRQPGKDIYLVGVPGRRQALSMPGWWMNSGSSSIRSSPVKGRRCLRRREVVVGSSCGRSGSFQAGVSA